LNKKILSQTFLENFLEQENPELLGSQPLESSLGEFSANAEENNQKIFKNFLFFFTAAEQLFPEFSVQEWTRWQNILTHLPSHIRLFPVLWGDQPASHVTRLCDSMQSYGQFMWFPPRSDSTDISWKFLQRLRVISILATTVERIFVLPSGYHVTHSLLTHIESIRRPTRLFGGEWAEWNYVIPHRHNNNNTTTTTTTSTTSSSNHVHVQIHNYGNVFVCANKAVPKKGSSLTRWLLWDALQCATTKPPVTVTSNNMNNNNNTTTTTTTTDNNNHTIPTHDSLHQLMKQWPAQYQLILPQNVEGIMEGVCGTQMLIPETKNSSKLQKKKNHSADNKQFLFSFL
jgi:hypothetical protein